MQGRTARGTRKKTKCALLQFDSVEMYNINSKRLKTSYKTKTLTEEYVLANVNTNTEENQNEQRIR